MVRMMIVLMGAAASLAASGCARSVPPTAPPAPAVASPPTLARSPDAGPFLPAIPTVEGPLVLSVVYPPLGATILAGDSSFVFGSTGNGRATLTVGGQTVPVNPNGTWLAWLRIPDDPQVRLTLVARVGADSAVLVHEFQRAARFRKPPNGLWVDTTSLAPTGRVWWPADEALPLRVRAAPGAIARLRLPGGVTVPLQAVPTLPAVATALRAFDRDTANLVRQAEADHYYGQLRGIRIGADTNQVLGRSAPLTGPDPELELVRGADTLRVRWPLRITLLPVTPVIAELDDDPTRAGGTDGITVGRATPNATYHWFFPTGTRAEVSGRFNGDVRLRLSAGSSSWVAAAEVRLLGAGGSLPPSIVGSVTATPGPDRVQLRIPLGWRVPFQVDETADGVRLRLYRAVGDLNWIRYGATTGLLSRVTWRQATTDEVEIEAVLTRPLWGYRTRWERTDLILELRPRPAINPDHPLQGRLIVVDPGHPPAGSTGPSGLREAEANLAVALVLEQLLQQEGARVVMTRRDDRAVDLWPRVQLADSLDADVLISIHNNALPDGVNPFRNNGSSTFYFHEPSLPLARFVQEALVTYLGLRDLGIGRGDLALVRGTWMPSILTEGMFMMMPEQESALRQAGGQRAYARAVVDGLRRFLAARPM